jgi:sugar lactone lactonase YvrE
MMSFLKNEDQPRICPKTGKTIQSGRKFRWQWWLLPFSGLAALIWFLVRVIPKPSRAAYPCQRLAFPIASGFITWVIGLAASTIAFHKAKRHLLKARYVMAAICIVISVTAIYVALSYSFQYQTLAAYSTPSSRIPQAANSPIGTGKGVHPGRVAWIWDPNATTWAGYPGDGNYYDPTHTDQNIVNAMVSKSLRALTGKSSDFAAWDAIFRNFNERQGKGNVGYQAGEKIMIKANLVGLIFTTFGSNYGATNKSNYLNYPNTSPQVMHAVLDQLVNVVGVNDVDIAIGDTLASFANDYYNKLHNDFPHATYIDYYGTSGRTKTTAPSTNPRIYWSEPNASRLSGKANEYVATIYNNASYVINLGNLKGHYNQAGITVCGKNHYGSLLREPSNTSYYVLHDAQIWNDKGMGHYRNLVDLMGHPQIGGKTLLCLVDGLYTTKHCRNNVWPGTAEKFPNPPFNNDWPSSFLASQDPVAVDSVAFDILYSQWPDVDGPGGDGADDYLHEAALAPNSPSGYSYDPDGDGNDLTSQGVHEHWNNSTNMQYTRNLGTGSGVELVTAASAGWPDLTGDWFVDFRDFARFAKAWRSISGNETYDPCCDISSPTGDGVIDEKDLYVLCDNWLSLLTNDVVVPGATIQQVYGEPNVFYEGATWDTNSNKFFFTRRTGTYQILRLESTNNATVWMNNAPLTNGMLLSLQGRLLTCDENLYQIRSHIIGESGPEDTNVLCTAPDKPNDLWELTNGNIYFTCPTWGSTTYQGVYLLKKSDGSVTRVNNALTQPNGIITSLDETKLYVSESSSSVNSNKRWWVFPINSDGSLGTGSVFFKPITSTYFDPDGMTIDERGNLYFTGLGGVWIVSPTGQQLKKITVPQQASNICFGGPDGKTLYITCQDKVYSLAMLVRGGE